MAIPESCAKFSLPEFSSSNGVFRDTVRLPWPERTFIHIETTEERLSALFGQFARGLRGLRELTHSGFNPEAFWRERVNFAFCSNEMPPYHRRLGQVGLFDDQYNCRIYPQNIINVLPLNTQLSKKCDYRFLPAEVKIRIFQQNLTPILLHEFFHLFQAMNDPDYLLRSLKKVRIAKRLFLFLAGGASVSILLPEFRPYVTLASVIYLGAFSYLTQDKYNLEKEAFLANCGNFWRGVKSPFSFSYEDDPD